MIDVLIFGVDIHGIELIDIIKRAGQYNLLGFIKQSVEIQKDTFGGYPVFGGAETLQSYPRAGCIPMHVWKSAQGHEQWVSLIDPSAFVASIATIGKGCVIYPHCFIGANAVLGDKVFMLSGSIINHDNVIGNGVTITSGVTLAGGVRIGSNAYLGQGCNIRQNLTVGDSALVGMGAVVTKNVQPDATVAGNPARVYCREASIIKS